MKRLGLFRFLCMAALALALFDTVADSVSCDPSGAEETACHACACGPHLASAGEPKVRPLPALVVYEPLVQDFYDDPPFDPLFRPPSLA